MVEHQSKDIVDRIHKDTKIQPASSFPKTVNPSIQPVLNVNPEPKIIVISDAGANDSDKTFTVPVGKQWKLLYGRMIFVTTATIGDRRMVFLFRDPNDNIIYEILSASVQTASLTEQYTFGNFGDVGELTGGFHTMPIPINSILPEGFDIRIFDRNAVAVAADDLNISLVIEETDGIET